jgi:hypothetical protein
MEETRDIARRQLKADGSAKSPDISTMGKRLNIGGASLILRINNFDLDFVDDVIGTQAVT